MSRQQLLMASCIIAGAFWLSSILLDTANLVRRHYQPPLILEPTQPEPAASAAIKTAHTQEPL